jgi:hypothetical protein
MILKGQTCSLSHERIDPILRFPLPQIIKQLRAFLGVTGFCRIWILRYAALARPLFMLLLIFLFGSCKINALSRFISQRVQRIKLQLLVKEYPPLPMHESSILFYGGPWKLHGSTLETSTTSSIPPSPYCQHKAARWVIAPLPDSSWLLVSEGNLLGLET